MDNTPIPARTRGGPKIIPANLKPSDDDLQNKFKTLGLTISNNKTPGLVPDKDIRIDYTRENYGSSIMKPCDVVFKVDPDSIEAWRKSISKLTGKLHDDVQNGKKLKFNDLTINTYDKGTIMIQGESCIRWILASYCTLKCEVSMILGDAAPAPKPSQQSESNSISISEDDSSFRSAESTPTTHVSPSFFSSTAIGKRFQKLKNRLSISPSQSPIPSESSPVSQKQSTPVKPSTGRPSFIHRISAVLSPSRSPPTQPRSSLQIPTEKHDDTILVNETQLSSQLAEAEATIIETQRELKESNDKSKSSTAKLLKELDDLQMKNERLSKQLDAPKPSPKTAPDSIDTSAQITSTSVENVNVSDDNIDSALNEAMGPLPDDDTTSATERSIPVDATHQADKTDSDSLNLNNPKPANAVPPTENVSTHSTPDENDSTTSPADESTILHDDSLPIRYKFDSDYWELSNFRHRSFFIFNKWWRSREHAYQWRKAIFHEKWKIADDILEARTAKYAKFLGGKVNSSPAWNNKKYRIMEGIMMSYAEQVEKYQRALLSTGSKLLLEDTPDEYWGAAAGGKNWHGRISMKVRAVLRSKQNYSTRSTSNSTQSRERSRQGTNPLAKTFIPNTYAEAVSHGVQGSASQTNSPHVSSPPPSTVTYGAPLPPDLARHFQGYMPQAPQGLDLSSPTVNLSYGAPLPPDLAKHFQGPVTHHAQQPASSPADASVPHYPAASPHALIFTDSMGKNIDFDMEGCKVSVSAHGGGRVRPAIQNLRNEMESSRYDSVTLNYGTNDVMNISPDTFGMNYSALVKQAKSQGASVICSSIFYRGDGRSRQETYEINQAIDQFNIVIRNICQVEHCYYIDNNVGQSAWEPNLNQLRGRMGEKLHLTPFGANNFRDRVHKAITCVHGNSIPPPRPTRTRSDHRPSNTFIGNNQFVQPPPLSTFNRFEPLNQPCPPVMYGAQYQHSVPPLMSLPIPPPYPGYPPPMPNYRHYM